MISGSSSSALSASALMGRTLRDEGGGGVDPVGFAGGAEAGDTEAAVGESEGGGGGVGGFCDPVGGGGTLEPRITAGGTGLKSGRRLGGGGGALEGAPEVPKVLGAAAAGLLEGGGGGAEAGLEDDSCVAGGGGAERELPPCLEPLRARRGPAGLWASLEVAEAFVLGLDAGATEEGCPP
jgi:hypothetical protein